MEVEEVVIVATAVLREGGGALAAVGEAEEAVEEGVGSRSCSRLTPLGQRRKSA